MTDYSRYFTVELCRENSWEVVHKDTSWDGCLDFCRLVTLAETQIRITTPKIEKSELQQNLEQIYDDHKRGLTTSFEYAERVVSAVTAAI